MNKSILVVTVLVLVSFLSGCAPVKTDNSAEQRARAEQAHGELSSDTKK